MWRRWCSALLIGAACALPARAAAPPELPQSLFGDESVASTDDARAAWFNPAALGVRHRSELMVSWSRFAEGPRDAGAAALALRHVGVFAARARDEAHTYGFDLAGGGEPLRAGFSTAWRVDPRTHAFTVDHAFGLLSRPRPWLSLGGSADHLFAPEFRGARLRREYTLGLGWRPLALSRTGADTWGTRLTFTSDVIVPEDGERRQSRVRVGASFEPVPGVTLRGTVEDHGSVHVGLGLTGPHLGVHAQHASHDGDAVYDSYALTLHGDEERTALAGRADRRVAVIRAGGDLGDDALSGIAVFGGGTTVPVKGLHDQLRRALDDPLTRGVLLDVRGVSGMAQIEELRPRIDRLRRAGKPVVAYLEAGGGRPDLYLASACDRIVTTEEAEFAALGLRAERHYYRRFLEDLGVRIDRTSYGKYKSAFRNFSVDSTPPADREVIEHVLDVVQEQFVSSVVADRHMSRERLLTLLDGRYWAPADLQHAGLVDSIGDRQDALAVLGRMCGLGARPRSVDLSRTRAATRAWTVPTRIAVVYASGGIGTGKSGGDLLFGPYMGAETVSRQVRAAFDDPRIRAVVLRVESPGGSTVASNLIEHAIARARRERGKPLVVSMGGAAASGGYYISVDGDRIYADRFTYTGSIGVVSAKPSFAGFYAKHDVRQDAFERGRFMRGWSTGVDWDRDLQAIADSATRVSYDRFVRHVAAGRHMRADSVDAIAQGRVWLGEDALRRGLVDEIGGLEVAIREARRRAGIPLGEAIRIAEYRRPRPGLLERLVGGAIAEAWARSMHLPEPGEALYWADDLEPR